MRDRRGNHIDSIVSIGKENIMIASEYGPTIKLDHNINLPFMICNAVICRKGDICEIYAYDLLEDMGYSSLGVPYGHRYQTLKSKFVFKRDAISPCGGTNCKFKSVTLRLAKFQDCGSGMQFNMNNFNFFISASFMKVRNINNFLFLSDYVKVDIIIRDRKLCLERKRYSKTDVGSNIEICCIDFRNCRMQGLLKRGQIMLLMTRICRMKDRDCSVIRYGFSQLHEMKNSDCRAIIVKAMFDPLLYRRSKIIFEMMMKIRSLEDELKKHKAIERDREKRKRNDVARRDRLRSPSLEKEWWSDERFVDFE